MNVAGEVRHARGGWHIVIRCLGRFGLLDASGIELKLRTRKARALLACLAATGRPMSRDLLADLLWSDRGPTQARSSLRQALFELQHLAGEGVPIVSAGRQDVATRADTVVTDLELIRSASAAGDWPRLRALLEESEPGLLVDLDGLDCEFDAWLRAERAHEPAKTLSIALSAARRCMAEAGPRPALELVSEILRLDTANEEAARLALRIDHELGDSAALHRHFHSLRDRLRQDYDAEPSSETVELFSQLTEARPLEPPTAAQRGAAARPPEAPAQAPPSAARTRPWALGAAALLVVAVIAIGALLWRSAPVRSPDEAVILAVLPFDQQPADERFLAEGLWDDTRTALSRNPALRVLGRATTEALAQSRADPASYRRRVGADYLLDGVVRRSGERVRVTVSLVSTADGKTVWADRFSGKLGDPLALQQAIASAIEGRLRGRLARGGGKRPEQIATTPEVYALYSEARSLLRQRQRVDARRAEALLRRAVALDPNYGPAWSSLASALYFERGGNGAQRKAEAISHAHRALALAPNLAQAHAVLALAQGLEWPPAEQTLSRAVALNPGDAEAWNWLGNVRAAQARRAAAVDAYRRAVEIDPLWWVALHNLLVMLVELGDHRSVNALIAQVANAGGDRGLVLSLRGEAAIMRSDYSAAARPLLDLLNEGGDGSKSAGVRTTVGTALVGLGYFDEAARLWRLPEWVGPALRSESVPPEAIAGERVSDTDFWLDTFSPAFATRAMLNRGEGGKVLAKYRRAFRTQDDFLLAFGEVDTLMATAPNVAVALRQAGEEAEADDLLQSVESRIEARLRNDAGDREKLWALGRVRAAEGRREEALRLLASAVAKGWLSDGLFYPLDIAQDPPLWRLRDNLRFQELRKRILGHIARERAELGPVKV